jgi:hypothetical protein
MAKRTVQIDKASRKLREVTVVVHVDGQEYETRTFRVPEFAIPYVVMAAMIQVEDPDLQGASEV